jgi:hypothetical protein
LLTFYGRKSRQRGDQVIIGDDYGTNVCVRLSDGAVYSIDPKAEYPNRFINSGIEQLARCIEVSETYSGTAGNAAELSREMRATLTEIDPKAFADPENWWALILEQMAEGL